VPVINARRAQVRDAMERYRKRRKCGPVAGPTGRLPARRDPGDRDDAPTAFPWSVHLLVSAYSP
jgi:hypothetical protein